MEKCIKPASLKIEIIGYLTRENLLLHLTLYKKMKEIHNKYEPNSHIFAMLISSDPCSISHTNIKKLEVQIPKTP